MKFITIQINKRWCDNPSMIILRYTFIANDPSKPNNTSTRIINVCLMNSDIYTIPPCSLSSMYEYLQYH